MRLLVRWIRIVVRITILLPILVLVVALTTLSFAPVWSGKFLATMIQGAGESHGIPISFLNPRTGGLSFQADSLSIGAPYNLTFNHPSLRFGFDIGHWRPTFTTQSEFLSGTIVGTGRFSFSGHCRGDISAQNLNIAELPIVRLTGTESGKLAFRIGDLDVRRMVPGSGTFRIELSGVNRKKVVIPGANDPILGIIPTIDNLSLVAQGALKNTMVTVDSLQQHSSLGTVSTNGYINFTEYFTGCAAASVKGQSQLSPHGVQEIGPLLTIVSKGALRSDTQRFRFELTGCDANRLIYDAR